MNIYPNPEDAIEILVVEDSVTQALFLRQLLEDKGGYRVRVATNGREGLLAAKVSAPTLIVSDIAMPEMDGYAMCQEIKKDPLLRDIPIILLTSLTSLYDVINGLDCGADNFIRKPFDATYLLGRIRFILANRALRSNERVQVGMQVNLGGQTHFITAERQQIFDLLISTYVEAIQLTEQLKAQQQETARSYQSLEGLYNIAEALNPALTEQAVVDLALDRVLDFPGVLGASIKLFDKDGRLRVAVVRDPNVGSQSCLTTCQYEWLAAAGAPAASQAFVACGRDGQSCLCIPLVTGARARGILCLLTDGATLPGDDRQVLETVGSQIAVALERADLYNHMEMLVKERTAAWESERTLLSAVVNPSSALVWLADSEGIVRLFNAACERTLGWRADEVLGRSHRQFFREADHSASLLDEPPAFGQPVQVQGEWLAKDGSVHTIVWSVSWLRRPDGSLEHVVGTGIDVTELRGVKEKLSYLSNFDAVTGLPNQQLLHDRVRQLHDKLADDQVLGYLLLKVPRLAVITASLGREAEQVVLLQIAERLGRWSPGDATVARVGERSFALVATRRGADELAALARQVLGAMDVPFIYQQQELHIDPCIGIAMFPNDGEDCNSIAQGAEAALQRALSSRSERFEFYRPELNAGVHERFCLEAALRRALERDELVVHYQPQVSLASGAIIGVEALVRWQHPELGLITPVHFIAVAEETGLIVQLGETVLRLACEQSCAWQRAGLPPMLVSVNLSARQFSAQVVDTVARILSETGLDPKLLELELTESASMEDPQKTIDILRQLKAMGVRLAIDDFGTGYSNLNYLKRFPVDKLKLDRSFVKGIVSDPDDLSISRAVIAMGHGLRLDVIAEGVETAGQLAMLAELGCDEIQGYFFSRPVDADACARMLGERKSLAMDSLRRQPYQRTLLYVDDEVNLLTSVRRALRHSGYRVLIADNANDAFEILAQTEVGVIVCDQRMPGMSGTEFLSRVKHIYPDTVRIVLSGYTDLQSVTDAVNHGAIFKFLTKPWVEDELAQAVRDSFDMFEAKRGASRGAGRA